MAIQLRSCARERRWLCEAQQYVYHVLYIMYTHTTAESFMNESQNWNSLLLTKVHTNAISNPIFWERREQSEFHLGHSKKYWTQKGLYFLVYVGLLDVFSCVSVCVLHRDSKHSAVFASTSTCILLRTYPHSIYVVIVMFSTYVCCSFSSCCENSTACACVRWNHTCCLGSSSHLLATSDFTLLPLLSFGHFSKAARSWTTVFVSDESVFCSIQDKT